MASELASKAVRHARKAYSVELYLENDRARVAVTHGSAALPHLRPPAMLRPGSGRGRGGITWAPLAPVELEAWSPSAGRPRPGKTELGRCAPTALWLEGRPDTPSWRGVLDVFDQGLPQRIPVHAD